MSKNSITFDNFMDFQGELAGVEVRSYMPLPSYAPTSEINVDLGRMARMARLGRIDRVRFGLYDETEEMNMMVGGVGRDGTASAVGAKSGAATRSISEINRDSSEMSAFPRGSASIKINASHPDLEDEVLREPEPWAKLLDKGMRVGLASASRKQLLEPTLQRTFVLGVDKSISAFWGGVNALAFQEPAMIPVAIGFFSLLECTKLDNFITRRSGKPDQDKEHSLFRYMPIDRYAVVEALVKTQKIIKTKK